VLFFVPSKLGIPSYLMNVPSITMIVKIHWLKLFYMFFLEAEHAKWKRIWMIL